MTSSPAAGLHIAEEVEALIGSAKAVELRCRLGEFTCTLCGKPGHPAVAPASLLVIGYGSVYCTRYAHAQCLPSCIVETPHAGGLVTTVELVPRAVGFPTLQGIRPVLLLAFEEELLILDDRTGPVPGLLQSLGLHCLSGLAGQVPASPGWEAQFGYGDYLAVSAATGPVLSEGSMVVPPVWQELVHADGDQVTVLVGRLDHEQIFADAPPLQAYHRAVRRGSLAGGRIAARFA